MTSLTRRTLFLLFFLSGFSSLIYQVVWTRMAFASFGIIAPVLSVVLSVFMLGLAVGSWAGGRFIAALVRKTGASAAFFYGITELVIGISAFAVPGLFQFSSRLLLPTGEMNSFNYLLSSALALAVSIFPWCVFMGATFPFMMAYVRERETGNKGSFSYLYLANVLGAMTGTLLTALVLVELLGFQHTLWVAAGSNFTIALISFALAAAAGKQTGETAIIEASADVSIEKHQADRLNTFILFSTGFLSMAMEVVWTRGFAPVLKTQVYSFAMIVFSYLGATFLGSLLYRRDLRVGKVRSHGTLLAGLAVTVLLPIAVNDPLFMVQKFRQSTIDIPSALALLASIVPFCALLGYLTPSLIDDYAAGNPRRAGTGYAINVLGCILGPLVACYLLLPNVSGRYALVILGIPFIGFWVTAAWPLVKFSQIRNGVIIAVAGAYVVFGSKDFEEVLSHDAPNAGVHRDYMASVLSIGDHKFDKWLIVNGTAMTTLTPVTKFMAHLPLALHEGPPKSVLVICFGMGTTFRSSLSWGVDTTVVELVPSVPRDFGFFYPDAAKSLDNPNGHIIIDDGRRYLSRCAKKFDVIVVDPPPPVEAAGSSLLFSKQFYELAKEHLNPNGIVAMWYPESHNATSQAVVRSIDESFSNTRCFDSVEGWGMHLLGSMTPIPKLTGAQLVAKMPDAAKHDLVEWRPQMDPATYFNMVLTHEYDVDQIINSDRRIEINDDHPFNEYFLLRQVFHTVR